MTPTGDYPLGAKEDPKAPFNQPGRTIIYDSCIIDVSQYDNSDKKELTMMAINYYCGSDYEVKIIDNEYIFERLHHVCDEWSLKHIIEHPQKSFIIDFMIEADKCHRVVSIDFEDLVAENYDCRYRDFLRNCKNLRK